MWLLEKIREHDSKFIPYLLMTLLWLSFIGSWAVFLIALFFISGDAKWITMIVTMFTFMPTFILILFNMPNKEKISRFRLFLPFILTYGLVLAMFFSILYGNGKAAILEGVGAAFLSAFCWGAYRDANPKDYGSLPWL